MELRKEFSFNDIAYHEATYNIDILLDGAGWYCFTAEEGTDTSSVEDDFADAFERATRYYGDYGVPYNVLPYDPASYTKILNIMLKDKWPAVGLSIKEFGLTELYPDESSIRLLIEAKKKKQAEERNTASRRICPKCGADMSGRDGARFCTECGTKLD